MTTHIDEGTIHAWIDGALDAERARAVEEHVRQCAQCGEAVAEARGLVAASSRILGALDDVPAGVIPKQAPVRKHKRVWRAAPWVTGIAAVLLAAVVLRTGDEVRREVPFIAVEKVTSAQPELVVDSAVERPQANQVAAAPPVVAAPTASIGPAEPVASVPRPTRTARASVGSVSGSNVASGGAATDLASAAEASKARALADAAFAGRAREASAQRAEVAPAAPAAPPIVDTAMERSLTVAAGCYVLPLTARGSAVAQEFAATRMRTEARRAAPSAAMAERADAAVMPGIIIRLDSLAGRAGYIVREARSDSSLGWWRPIGADSARVDLQGVVSLIAAGNRIVCPQR